MNGEQSTRARSLGRSRSRSRHPSELLARRQQQLATNNGVNNGGGGGVGHIDSVDSIEPHESVEARLESLSEMLKNHQQQQQQQLNENGTDNLMAAKSIDDVYILLAKKEKDLQLAAELGKVLLEKNDELSKANERITEEYSQKLELLEQDKHKLRRKLELQNGEYENRVIELQTDCNILKNQLEEQQQVTKQTEKEKSKLIDDLVQQNQRLTSELLEATKSEELLSSQLEQITERFNVRLSSRQDHVSQLEALNEEIHVVNQRKQDLERRLKVANSDKSNLSAALDEAGDKIILLEGLIGERDSKLSELLEEISELRDSSSWLSNELESMICLNERLAQSALNASDEMNSGNNSSQKDDCTNVSQTKRSQLIESLRELRLKSRIRQRASERLMERRRELANNNNHNGSSSSAYKNSSASLAKTNRRRVRRRKRDHQKSSLFDEIDASDDDHDHDDDESDNDQVVEIGMNPMTTTKLLSEELALELFTMLKQFQLSLQQRKDTFYTTNQTSTANNTNNNKQIQLFSPNSADDSGISADDLERSSASEFREQANDPSAWRRLFNSIKSLIEEMPCSSCQLMIAERADYEQLQRTHARLCEELRKKNDELLALNAIQPELEAKVVAFEERCKILTDDLSNCDKPKEEIVKLAWKARDEAVARKNAAEISLAKARIENMQISSQLMEVVQQKGELSQKLAQFEDDIHYMTQDSVKAKFTWEEYAEKLRRSKTYQPESAPNLNPLIQLLSFSVASSSHKEPTTTTASASQYQSQSIDGSGSKGGGSQTENQTHSSNLMRNLTGNKFNLKFWQRSSSGDKTASDNNIKNDDKPPIRMDEQQHQHEAVAGKV